MHVLRRSWSDARCARKDTRISEWRRRRELKRPSCGFSWSLCHLPIVHVSVQWQPLGQDVRLRLSHFSACQANVADFGRLAGLCADAPHGLVQQASLLCLVWVDSAILGARQPVGGILQHALRDGTASAGPKRLEITGLK